MKKIPKIIIHVSGGLVQNIFPDTPVDIVIVDEDNIEEDEERSFRGMEVSRTEKFNFPFSRLRLPLSEKVKAHLANMGW